MKSALQILTEGVELIRDPDNWTQFVLALDEDDNQVLPEDPKAVCFCSVGALDRASGMPTLATVTPIEYVEAYQALEMFTNRQAISIFNDSHTHAEVIKVWDDAIRMLSA